MEPIRSATQRRRWRILLAGFAVVAAAVTLLLARLLMPLAEPLLWAGVLTMLVYPAHRRARAAVRRFPTVAAAITTLAVATVLVVPAVLVSIQVVREARGLWPEVRTLMRPAALHALEDRLDASPVGPLYRQIAGEVPSDGSSRLEKMIEGAIEPTRDWLMSHLGAAAARTTGFAVSLAVALIALFFFLRDGPRYVDGLRELLPLPPDYVTHLEVRLSETVAAVFRGILITALGQGLLVGAAYFLLGVPAPFLFTVLTIAAAFVPVGGAALVWVPVAAGLFIAGMTGAGIVLTVWAVIVGVAENFVKPWIIGSEADLPVLFLLLSLLGGLATFGPLGILVGPAALALALACLQIYREYHDIWRERGASAPASPRVARRKRDR